MFFNYTENSTFYFFSTGAQSIASIVGLSAAVAVFRYQCFQQNIAEKRQHILGILKGSGYIGMFEDSEQLAYIRLTSDKERIEWWREILKSAYETGNTKKQDGWFVAELNKKNLAGKTDEDKLKAIQKQITIFKDNYLEYGALDAVVNKAERFKKRVFSLTAWGLVLVGYGILGTLAPTVPPSNICGQLVAKTVFVILLGIYLLKLYSLIVQAFEAD